MYTAIDAAPSRPGLPPLHSLPDCFPFCLDRIDCEALGWQSHEKLEPRSLHHCIEKSCPPTWDIYTVLLHSMEPYERKPDKVSSLEPMIKCSLCATHCDKMPMSLSYLILITLEIMIMLLTILKAITTLVIDLLLCARPSSTCITHLIFTTILWCRYHFIHNIQGG